MLSFPSTDEVEVASSFKEINCGGTPFFPNFKNVASDILICIQFFLNAKKQEVDVPLVSTDGIAIDIMSLLCSELFR